MKKNIFVVIVTYNGAKWLDKLFRSLQGSIYPVSVLVVDNNSSDESVKIVKSFPDITLIESKKNLGFGKANNLAIKKVLELHADYVFLLNQDTLIYPDTIANLLSASESNKDFGILSPLHFSSSEKILDENFKTYWERDKKLLSENLDQVSFVNAAAWFIPIDIIKQIGYFEPLFSHYGEDRNFVNRMHFHKYKVGIIKNAKISHYRTTVRGFKKDSVQSKYMMLNEVLNINNSLFLSYWRSFVSVFGLPKYFAKYYSVSQTMKLFFSLLFYFLSLKAKVFLISNKRANYK